VIQLSDELEQQIRAHAVQDFPYECCGVMLGSVEGDTKTVHALKAIQNEHADGHERRYLISPDEMFRLDREARAGGYKILGFYHSHPNHPARPSIYDRDWAWPWYSYIIVSSKSGGTEQMTSWCLKDDSSAFTAERIEPWEGARVTDYEAVMSSLAEEDVARCLPLTDSNVVPSN
jgi:proteasome lid subunit RPN8/RPN11